MNHKDYSIPYRYFQEAFIDISFKENKATIFSDVISMWGYDFNFIMEKIPLNEDGMYVGLVCHYHVDEPWVDCEDEPWEVDELEVSLSQLEFVRELFQKQDNEESEDREENKKLYEI